MVRLKDIAAQAGVSLMTVSKALRDTHDVSEGTKTRIKAIAKQLGYVPDSTAQGLRTRTTRLFGVLVSALSSPIFSRVVLAIEERAHDLGYEVMVAQTLACDVFWRGGSMACSSFRRIGWRETAACIRNCFHKKRRQ